MHEAGHGEHFIVESRVFVNSPKKNSRGLAGKVPGDVRSNITAPPESFRENAQTLRACLKATYGCRQLPIQLSTPLPTLPCNTLMRWEWLTQGLQAFPV